jgi:hypothetical protein
MTKKMQNVNLEVDNIPSFGFGDESITVSLKLKQRPETEFALSLSKATASDLVRTSPVLSDDGQPMSTFKRFSINREAIGKMVKIQAAHEKGNRYLLESVSWLAGRAGRAEQEKEDSAKRQVPGSLIPPKFIGTWIERKVGEHVVSELRIQSDKIEWTRRNEEKHVVTKYWVEDNGETVCFDSKVTYAQDVYGPQAYKGNVQVRT